jgi:hypothetical protein
MLEEVDPQQDFGLLVEIKKIVEDRSILKQYIESNQGLGGDFSSSI